MPRRQGKLSNADIAHHIGVDPTQISRLRAGKRRPSNDTTIAIQQLVGWSAEEQSRLLAQDKQLEREGTLGHNHTRHYAKALNYILERWDPYEIQTPQEAPPTVTHRNQISVQFSNKE